MATKRSFGLPITLAVVMIVLLVALTVGWVIMAVFNALAYAQTAGIYWTLLAVGATFLVLVLVGVVLYLWITLQVIALTRRQSNFIDSVTHELKSPIASLKLYLQTLRRHRMDAEQRTEFYDSMLEDIDRLDRLTSHLLDAARMEDDEEDLVERIAVDDLIRECTASVCDRYGRPMSVVKLDLQPVEMMERVVALEMIFRNLIDNAVKYASDPPEVEISLGLEQGEVVCRISDNGPGIPIRSRDRIFDRFERLGIELERETPGTGLGLYIVSTLLTRLRGNVQIMDRPSGPGSVFELRLPEGTLRAEAKSPSPTRASA